MEKENDLKRDKREVSVLTDEGRIVDIAGSQAQYDSYAKNILAHKRFLAIILKETVSGLANFSVDEIIKSCLTEKPEISTVPVDRDADILPKVESQNTEDISIREGVSFYDLKFNIRIPGSKQEIKLIINIESQKKKEKYPLEKRGMYYVGRLISSQKGTIFKSDHYEGLCKVYSIWICPNVTADMKNTVTVYNVNENDIIGSRKARKEDYDLFCMVMIGLGNHADAQSGTMLKMLDVLFSKDMESVEKRDLLENQCGIPMKEEKLAEEVDAMCNLGQGIYEEGIEIGIDKGEKLRALKAAKKLLALGKTTIEEIAMCTDLTVDEVKKLEEEMCAMA